MRHSLKPPVILLHPAHRSVSSNGYLLGFTSFATFQLLCIFQPICFPVVRWHLNWLLNKRDITLWDRHSLPSELQFLYCLAFIELAAQARLTGRFSVKMAHCSLDSHPFILMNYIGDIPMLSCHSFMIPFLWYHLWHLFSGKHPLFSFSLPCFWFYYSAILVFVNTFFKHFLNFIGDFDYIQ